MPERDARQLRKRVQLGLTLVVDQNSCPHDDYYGQQFENWFLLGDLQESYTISPMDL